MSMGGVKLFLHYGDLTDSVSLVKLIYQVDPDEICHLGAQSHVRVSYEIPEHAFARLDLDWREFVKHDGRYERPAEVELLVGDAAKANASSTGSRR